MANCLHHLEICGECGGLDVTTLTRVPGVLSISIDEKLPRAVFEVFAGPARTDCSNTPVTEES